MRHPSLSAVTWWITKRSNPVDGLRRPRNPVDEFCFAHGRGAKYCNQRVSVSLCHKTKRPNIAKFSVLVACGSGAVLFWGQCNTLCISGFVDDVMFSLMERIGQNQGRRVCFVRFAGWRQRGRSLPTASCYRLVSVPWVHFHTFTRVIEWREGNSVWKNILKRSVIEGLYPSWTVLYATKKHLPLTCGRRMG